MNRLTTEEIKKVIPHREPFIFLDTVLDYKIYEYLEAEFYIRKDLDVFRGHYPDKPIFPGVLIIESMAQASVVLGILSSEKSVNAVYFLSADKIKFRNPVLPGDTLQINIKIIQQNARCCKVKAIAKVKTKIVAEGILIAMIDE